MWMGDMVQNATVNTYDQGSELDQVLTHAVSYTALYVGFVLSPCTSLWLLRRQPEDDFGIGALYGRDYPRAPHG